MTSPWSPSFVLAALLLPAVLLPGRSAAQEPPAPPTPAGAPAAPAHPAGTSPATPPPPPPPAALVQQEPATSPDRPPEAQDRGTHLLIELGGGSTTFGSGGPAFTVLFGGGGKLQHIPLRLYLFGEMTYMVGRTSGETGLLGLSYTDQRAYGDLALGLRLYLPLAGRLRLFTEGLAGASHVGVHLEREELGTVSAGGWVPLAGFGAGLQYRVLSALSLGLRGKLLLTDDDIAGLRRMTGDGSPLRSTAMVCFTWHF